MASPRSNLHQESTNTEQIITEFFAKCLHIILESRSPCAYSRNYSGEQTQSSPSSSSSSSSSFRPRDKWLNLALRDCVVDVILVRGPVDCDPVRCSPRRGLVKNLSVEELFPNFWNSGHEECLLEEKSEKIIERWVIQYKNQKSRDFTSGSKRSGGTSSKSLYKKSIVLLRSLYLTVRLLPAHKLFRDLNKSGQIHTYTLSHRVSSSVEPFNRREEEEMRPFNRTEVDTSCGRLCLSVLYRPTLSDLSLEPSTPISPQFIPDYVGSPMTDPLKRFPSLPLAGMVAHGSPSSFPFSRRHSWGYDIYKASQPSVSPSPSPTYSDSRALLSNLGSHRLPPVSLPRHPHETPSSSNVSLCHQYNTSFDEYWPSPIFSPSSSPSPPTHIPSSHPSNALLRCDSAPVSIPAARFGRSPGLPNNHIVPLAPFSKSSRPSSSQTDNSRALLRPGNIQTSVPVRKFSLGKDEVGNLPGAKISSNSSPQISISRSSSRLSFLEAFDDSEFPCPFAVDYDDIRDMHTRYVIQLVAYFVCLMSISEWVSLAVPDPYIYSGFDREPSRYENASDNRQGVTEC
ncbi:hypothetical protein HHK36_009299 [Tetracentron sinense]|uniref:Autophagy-related protein 13 N-terminal domain-containing protein n=1 Tax=Tetracentron sinense TaxID=13715 RepID=A0A834ZBH3_TETSI|nr:hypothetical protein HHK36_009299 [Tetracentron sinense]